MGAFFSNVQVKGDERAHAWLVEALRQAADQAGADAIDSAEGADRTVLVLPPDAGGWIAVYDEATEEQDTARLDALAALASRAPSSSARPCAFSVLVHDSDVLALSLFADGVSVDRYDSNPTYFAPRMSKAKRQKLSGAPAAWAPWLVGGGSEADLREAFAGEEVFAEATLGKICALIGCEPARAQLGHRYANALPGALPAGTVRLCFRSRARPAHEGADAGPPRFEAYAPYGVQAHTLATGDELRLSFSVRNVGGASAGFSIVIFGPALTAGLVEVERLELVVGNPLKGAKHQVLVPERRTSTEGEALAVLALPTQALVAGIDLQTWQPDGGGRSGVEAMLQALVHVNVVGSGIRGGSGALSCAFVPDANREDGAMSGQYDLTIVAPSRRPLRVSADAASPSISALLRQLADERYLHALLPIDAPREDGVSFARACIEVILGIVGTEGDVSTGVYPRDPRKRARNGKGKAASLLKGKRFDGLMASMIEELMLEISVRIGPAFDETTGAGNAGLWGISFGTGALGDRDSERVPTLACWVDTLALGPTKTAAIRAGWSAIIDRAMSASAGGTQGVLWRGGRPSPMYTSTYEQVCETPQSMPTARVWVQRWVRVPGNDLLWLGPRSCQRLDPAARAALSSIADVAPVGEGLRIALRNPARAGELEIAIAALLPTKEEAYAASMTFMGQR